MSKYRNSILELMRRPRSGFGRYSQSDHQPKVVVIQKNDESLWTCLRSKPCVCTLLSFFVVELLALAVVGLGIYLNYTKDGTLPCYLAPTANAAASASMQAPLPSKTVAVGTSRDSRENFMFGALFHQHQSLAYYVGLVKPLQKNLGYSQSNVGMDSTTSDFRFARARGGGLEAANHQTNWIAQQRDLGREVSDDAVLRWGYGTEYSLDGGHVIYSGQWEDGLRHGFGTEYQDTPRVYYKGQWKAGQHHGKGRDVLDGEANYYEGHFANGLRHGHGILRLANKNYTYEGGWAQDKMHGFGKLKMENGVHYEGYWDNNQFHGQGLYTDSEGNVFNGTFVRNQKNGCATNKDIEETTEQGLWKHDIKQGLFKIVYSNGSQFCVNYVDGHVNGAPRGGKCTECPTLDEKKACVCL